MQPYDVDILWDGGEKRGPEHSGLVSEDRGVRVSMLQYLVFAARSR